MKNFSLRPFLGALLSCLFLFLSSPGRATWFYAELEPGFDTIMMSLRYPWLPENTYNAHWNFSFLEGDKPSRINGYGGFAFDVPTVYEGNLHMPDFESSAQTDFKMDSVWSFWGENEQGQRPQCVAASRYTYFSDMVAEGASFTVPGFGWPVLPGDWFTTLIRVWQPADNPNIAYMGRWVKLHKTGEWILYGVSELPVPVTSFKNNAEFLEDYKHWGRSVRAIDRGPGYYRLNNEWKGNNKMHLTFSGGPSPWYVSMQDGSDYFGEGHDYLSIELTAKQELQPLKLSDGELVPNSEKAYEIKQPAEPVLDEFKVENLKASATRKQVAVSWDIPKGSPPQLGYHLEIFQGNERVHEERVLKPWVHDVLVNLEQELPPHSVKVHLTVIDIFDRELTFSDIQPGEVDYPVVKGQQESTGLVSDALRFEYYENDTPTPRNVLYEKGSFQGKTEKRYWVALDEFSNGTMISKGLSRGLDVTIKRNRYNAYGFKFNGFLKVPASGIYFFRAQVSDTYRLQVGDAILEREGLSGPEEQVLKVYLEEGFVPFEVIQLADTYSAFFQLKWHGPGFGLQTIASDFFYAEPGSISDEQLANALSHEKTEGGGVRLHFENPDPSRNIAMVQVLWNDSGLYTSSENSFMKECFPPAGKGELSVRFRYEDLETYVIDPVEYDIPKTDVLENEFGLSALAEVKLNASGYNFQLTEDKELKYVGKGENFLYSKVKGDFMLTCQIKDYAAHPENAVNDSCWVGLKVRSHPEHSEAKPLGGDQFYAVQTSGLGFRTSPNHTDFGYTRLSFTALDAKPWIRIVRKGNEVLLWTSADGQKWEYLTTEYTNLLEEVGAGLVFRTYDSPFADFYTATVSDIELTTDVDPEFQSIPPTREVVGLDRAPFRGVVVAPSDPQSVALRTADKGILLSRDQGRSFRSISDSALPVRSVAFHPGNPAILYAAFGDGSLEGSSLQITEDSGQNWRTIDIPVDFDGLGNSSVCGEIIRFDPQNEDTILVGTESQGLWGTRDGGKTWKQIIKESQTVTGVAFDNWSKNLVHVVTTSQSAMSPLGLESKTKPENDSEKISRYYRSQDLGETFQLTQEVADIGFLNVLPGHIATTHGIADLLHNAQRMYLLSTIEEGGDRLNPVSALSEAMIPKAQRNVISQAFHPRNSSIVNRTHYISWTNAVAQKFPQGVSAPENYGVIAATATKVFPYLETDNWWLVTFDGLYLLETEDEKTTGFKKVYPPQPAGQREDANPVQGNLP